MLPTYQKTRYEPGYGIRLNHTAGTSAEDSTLGYPHWTTEFLLFYFIQGTGSIKIEGRHYSIHRGDMILLNPSELFHCTVDEGIYHERIVLHINETVTRAFPCNCHDLFIAFYKRPKGIGNHISAQATAEKGLDALVHSIYQHIRCTDPVNTVLTVCKTMELLAKLNELLVSAPAESQSSAHENPLIQNVLFYLNEHFREDISISEIAQKFRVDKSYLSHLFKTYVGTSLWNYVIFRRIYLFNSLISWNCSIEEASIQAGFHNYSNFFRLYKKHMKMTPAQFKKQLDITK